MFLKVVEYRKKAQRKAADETAEKLNDPQNLPTFTDYDKILKNLQKKDEESIIS